MNPFNSHLLTVCFVQGSENGTGLTQPEGMHGPTVGPPQVSGKPSLVGCLNQTAHGMQEKNPTNLKRFSKIARNRGWEGWLGRLLALSV